MSTDNIIKEEDLAKWPYLDGFGVPHIQADMELLIGTNTSKLLEPWKVVNGQWGGPYTIRTCMSWIWSETNCQLREPLAFIGRDRHFQVQDGTQGTAPC